MSRPLHRLGIAVAAVLAAGALPALGIATAGAAPDDSMFSPAPSFQPTGSKVRVSPDSFSAVEVDLAAVRTALGSAPSARSGTSSIVFRVPAPSGGTERFAVQRTTLMQPKLAAAHPEISTYAGRSLEHAGTTIALDVTPMGFHASVRASQGQRAWYVDPAYNKRGTATHLSYYGGDVPRPEEEFVERETDQIRKAMKQRASGEKAAPGALVKQRVYRLALTSDPSYADYFGTENVAAEKVTLMNRVNQIYNDDVAINLQLVDENDLLNFDTEAEATGPDGPCGAHPCFDPLDDGGTPDDGSDDIPGQLDFCDVPLLGRNRVVLGQLIGAENYDIGHIALGKDGGGVAYFGVGQDYKGGGCTGLSEPKGDFFAIDYVAHEMGHQFYGNHTFNGRAGNCFGGNRNRGTSVEPGSGSSVMAYAGICGQDDLQPHTDPYFSQRSIQEMATFTESESPPQYEVQSVALSGFNADGETITIGYGAETPVTLTRGTDYDADGIEAAVEGLTGEDVSIAGWGFDTYAAYFGYPGIHRDADDTGFQVLFAADLEPESQNSSFLDMGSLLVSSTSPGVTASVGETTKGGPAGNQGFQVIETANHAPSVSAPANRTIPLRTPFKLTGSGSDTDGDSLTFLWEQNDDGGASGTALVDQTKKNGPLFRVFGKYANVTDEGTLESPSPGENLATGNPSRTFPDLAQILSGNTNAETGKCPKVTGVKPVKMKPLNCFSEFLPTKGYVGTGGTAPKNAAMHFRVTARDATANGGGTAYDDVTLRIAQDAGPFLVTSQAKKSDVVKGGNRAKVTWQVNGTKKLAKKVRILLSTNGGKTWKVLTKTGNDGKQAVKFPKGKTNKARIMVEAVDNYFFAVNGRNFRIK